jgi:hypothetical protein
MYLWLLLKKRSYEMNLPVDILRLLCDILQYIFEIILNFSDTYIHI